MAFPDIFWGYPRISDDCLICSKTGICSKEAICSKAGMKIMYNYIEKLKAYYPNFYNFYNVMHVLYNRAMLFKQLYLCIRKKHFVALNLHRSLTYQSISTAFKFDFSTSEYIRVIRNIWSSGSDRIGLALHTLGFFQI